MIFALSFGTIIGVGWITVLGSWLSGAGSIGAITAFTVGGLLIIMIALAYAEVALMFPVSGGEVAYAYRMFGTFTGFIVGWFLALSYISTCSFEAVSIAWLTDAILPDGKGQVLYSVGGEDVYLRTIIVAFFGTAIIALTNYLGAKTASTVQLFMVGALVIASVVFAAMALTSGEVENVKPLFSEAQQSKTGLLSPALMGVLGVIATTPFWYAGFDTIPQAMGEIKEDVKPRSLVVVIMASIAAAIVFYAVIIMASSLSAPRDMLLDADLPAAYAMEQAFQSKAGRNFVLGIGLCGLISTWNAIFFAATRVIYTLSKARFLPPVFSIISNRYGTPSTSILFVSFVSFLGAMIGKTAVSIVVDLSALILSVIFLAIVFGVIQLRRTAPDLPRPFLAPFGSVGLYAALISAILVFAIAGMQFLGAALSGDLMRPSILIGWGIIGIFFWQLSSNVRKGLSKTLRDNLLLESDVDLMTDHSVSSRAARVQPSE